MSLLPRLYMLRAVAIAAVAALAVSVSELGPDRFVIAGILVFGLIPATALIEYKYPAAKTQWVAPVPEILATLAVIQLAPQYWHTGVCVALMLALAPSINNSRRPAWVHAAMGTLVIAGMGFTGWWHGVPGWVVTIVAISLVYPTIVVYAGALAAKRGDIKGQAQALSSLNLIAGSVAHRFSNAIMAVTGNLELVARELPSDHPLTKYIRNALNAADSAGQTSKQLASFAGGTLNSHRQVRIASELDIVVELMKLIVRDGIRLQYVMPKEELVVTGPRFHLQHLMMSALMKIAEGMKSPGRIMVSCQREAKIVVEIRDASLASVEYRALDASTFGVHATDLDEELEPLDPQDGTVQLAMVDGRIAAMRMLLVGRQLEEAPAPSAEPVNQTPRVLVIDDEEAVRNTLVAMLKHLDCEPVAAKSGRNGLDILESEGTNFDHVFLDLKMPGMDGWETLSEIRKLDPELPVTIASGYDPRSERERPPEYVSYLQKPFTMDGVKRVLH